IKRAHLLTPQDRHWYAQEGTLSARPVLGVLQAVSFFQSYQFCLGQQPKPQIVCCFLVFVFLTDDLIKPPKPAGDNPVLSTPQACVSHITGEFRQDFRPWRQRAKISLPIVAEDNS
ncbi:MAG: hypothetical protein P4L87_17635, partial [Formivibrio sp.]|nr:hypothetical protein [Formivibrio sp.]